jgi:hypothetical protein
MPSKFERTRPLLHPRNSTGRTREGGGVRLSAHRIDANAVLGNPDEFATVAGDQETGVGVHNVALHREHRAGVVRAILGAIPDGHMAGIGLPACPRTSTAHPAAPFGRKPSRWAKMNEFSRDNVGRDLPPRLAERRKSTRAPRPGMREIAAGDGPFARGGYPVAVYEIGAIGHPSHTSREEIAKSADPLRGCSRHRVKWSTSAQGTPLTIFGHEANSCARS